ncbi:hypothetical protein IT401_00380 [Candidatus Nomurabacteria bacterium]|nr:hypothetical protein [Candidatus Nomurabacteria bacterium]
MHTEKTFMARFLLWKEKNPTGSEADFSAAAEAARNKHSITPLIVATTDGTIMSKMNFEERRHFSEENRGSAFFSGT